MAGRRNSLGHMKLSFFADENIGTELINWLKHKSYNVTSVKEAGLSGISDETIIEKCYNEELIIITQDNDFGKIIYKQNASFHIVILFASGTFNQQYSYCCNSKNFIT